jgi:hypothetical protein
VAEQQSPVEKQIGDLEIAVDRLRSLYEQYFMGIEKIEPMVPRKDVDRRIYTVRKEQIRNTALRFRFQMILQRYNTYQTHWQRICREIENGTYKRHLLRAKQRFGSQRPQAARERPAPGAAVAADLAAELAELDREFASAEFQIDVEVELPDAPPRTAPSDPPPRLKSLAPPLPPPRPPLAPRTGTPLPPPRPRAGSVTGEGGVPPLPPPRPRAPSVTGEGRPPSPQAPSEAGPSQPQRQDLPDARMKQLYAQLVEAKRRQNESTAAVTYQSVAKTLRESGEKLREKHGRAVDFEVTIKDGKAILKPVLK